MLASTPTVARTKYRVPRPRRDAVRRDVLLSRVRASVLANPVTVVVAPAGYGKTTLLAQVAAALHDDAQVAWIANDDGDDDANRFFANLVHAVSPLGLAFEEEPAALIASVLDANRQGRAAVGALVNALCTSASARLVLVLDDLHHVRRAEAATLLEALIERLPEHVSVLLAGRALPPVPVARWVIRGEAEEFGPRDLQFGAAEAAALAATRAVQATDADVERVVRRVHGWPAGVSLLLRTHVAADAPSTRGYTEQHLYDYLADEVLARLPADLQRFAIDCSVLAELRPDACEAVSGSAEARALLRALYRRDLFVTAIDGEIPVLRFHDLFRDFLQHRLAAEPERLRALHSRAARAERDLARAIGHHLAAREWGDALALLAGASDTLLAEGGHQSMERWLDRIPEAAADSNFRWHYLRGVCAWRRRDWFRSRDELRRALQLADDSTPPALRARALCYEIGSLNGVGERERARALASEVDVGSLGARERAAFAVQRAWNALGRGASPEAVEHLRDVAAYAVADPPGVAPHIAEFPQTSYIGLPGALGAYRDLLGAWHAARGTAAAPWHAVPAILDGWTALWVGDLARAVAAQQEAREIGRRFGGVSAAVEDGLVRLEGMLCALTGRGADAVRICEALLQRFERPEFAPLRVAFESVYVHGFARAAWAAGERDAVLAIAPRATATPATTAGTSVQHTSRAEPMVFVPVAAGIVAGQVALLREDWADAARILEPLVATHRTCRFPQAHGDPRVGLAHALLMLGRRAAAAAAIAPVLDECLTEQAIGPLLWEPAWLVRPLLEPGIVGRGPAGLRPLLERLDGWHAAAAGGRSAAAGPATAPPAGPLASLTDREREVLARVADGASNKEIARDLDLSLHTVKRHIANILGKLDCVSRRQAADLVRRAGRQG
jgi:LuxR family maltose regulon positive regulatory protein